MEEEEEEDLHQSTNNSKSTARRPVNAFSLLMSECDTEVTSNSSSNSIILSADTTHKETSPLSEQKTSTTKKKKSLMNDHHLPINWASSQNGYTIPSLIDIDSQSGDGFTIENLQMSLQMQIRSARSEAKRLESLIVKHQADLLSRL